MEIDLKDITAEELTAELERIKDNLRDLGEMHAFTFGKTSVLKRRRTFNSNSKRNARRMDAA